MTFKATRIQYLQMEQQQTNNLKIKFHRTMINKMSTTKKIKTKIILPNWTRPQSRKLSVQIVLWAKSKRKRQKMGTHTRSRPILKEPRSLQTRFSTIRAWSQPVRPIWTQVETCLDLWLWTTHPSSSSRWEARARRIEIRNRQVSHHQDKVDRRWCYCKRRKDAEYIMKSKIWRKIFQHF